MKTIICDIDGTLLFHNGSQNKQIINKPRLLPGTIEKFHDWDKKGYKIILITGRRESTREVTKEQLRNCGIIYDNLIMGVGRGPRVLINDRKENNKDDTAIAINLVRNEGISSIEV
jgi:ribonucleotide monophosphatase NagD (HAD superfamily)